MDGFTHKFVSSIRNAFVALICITAILALGFNMIQTPKTSAGTLALSQLILDAQSQQISSIEIQYDDPHDLMVTYVSQPNRIYYTRLPNDTTLIETLQQAHIPYDSIDVRVAPRPAWGNMGSTLSILAPVLLFVGAMIFFIRRARIQQAQMQRAATDTPPAQHDQPEQDANR